MRARARAGALIAARTVQGIGAAMVMPLALALLNAAVPPQRRGWAMGIFGSVTALAVVVGPVLGGAITQGIAWQWIFWLNVPIGLLTIPLALRRLEESYGPRAALDVPGLVLGSGAALGLVWGLVRASSAGWASPEVAGALAAGVVLAVAFTGWELRARAPMLPMRLFAIRGFSAGNAVVFLLNASVTGAVFFMAQFQQVGLGQDPLGAGLRLLPWGVAPFLIAPRAGKLADRIGERPLVVSGTLLQAVGFAWIAVIAAPRMPYLAMLAPMMISGAGLGLALPAVTKAVVGSVPHADIGKASGSFSTMRQLGGAFGIAILAAVFAAAGGYTSAAAFSAGFAPATAAAAALALAGALAGLAMPGRQARHRTCRPSSCQWFTRPGPPRRQQPGGEHNHGAATGDPPSGPPAAALASWRGRRAAGGGGTSRSCPAGVPAAPAGRRCAPGPGRRAR